MILQRILDVLPQCEHPDWLRQIEEYKSAEVLPPAKGFSPRANH